MGDTRAARLKDLQLFLELHRGEYNSRRASLMHHFLGNVYVSVNREFIVVKNTLRSKKDALIVPFTPTESDNIINHTSANIIGAPVRKAMHSNHRIDLAGRYTNGRESGRITTLTPAEAKFLAYTAYALVYKDTKNSFRDSRAILLIFTNYLLHDAHTTYPSQNGAQLLLKGTNQGTKAVRKRGSQALIIYRTTATDIIDVSARSIQQARGEQRQVMFNSSFKPFDRDAAIQNATTYEIKAIDNLISLLERHAVEGTGFSRSQVMEKYNQLIGAEEALEERARRGEELRSYMVQTHLRDNNEFMRIPKLVDEITQHTKEKLEEYLLQETGTLIHLPIEMPFHIKVLFRQCEVFTYDYRIKWRIDRAISLQYYEALFKWLLNSLKGQVYTGAQELHSYVLNEYNLMNQKRFPYNQETAAQRIRQGSTQGATGSRTEGKRDTTSFNYEALARSVVKRSGR